MEHIVYPQSLDDDIKNIIYSPSKYIKFLLKPDESTEFKDKYIKYKNKYINLKKYMTITYNL